MNTSIENINFAAGSTSNIITMSKAKHPANIVLLTASEHFLLSFVHICPTTVQGRLTGPVNSNISTVRAPFFFGGGKGEVRVSKKGEQQGGARCMRWCEVVHETTHPH